LILITGGGTGGHLYPGLAAARALLEAGEPVSYIGAMGGIEEQVLPESGLPFRIIPAGKLSRDALRPSEAWKVLRGLREARKLLGELQPKAVLTTGGYAGFPVAFMASLAGIPVVIHEQNARLGLANRWLAARARRLALTVPIRLRASLAAKSEVVGLPVREEQYPEVEARARLGLDNIPTIFVMGGSQGSKELNDHLPERLYPLLGHWQVIHQCGLRWVSQMKDKSRSRYQIRGYLDTALAWSAADFAITRGGAGTLAEAAYHQVPLLIIPLPAKLDDGTQQANAGFYTERGAALKLDRWGEFYGRLNALLEPSTRRQMQAKLAGLSPSGAACKLAKAVLGVA